VLHFSSFGLLLHLFPPQQGPEDRNYSQLLGNECHILMSLNLQLVYSHLSKTCGTKLLLDGLNPSVGACNARDPTVEGL